MAGAPDEDVVGREQTFRQRINVLVIAVQEQTVSTENLESSDLSPLKS